MDLVMHTIDEYEMKKAKLLQEYKLQASKNFDGDLLGSMNKTFELIKTTNLNNIERYLRLFDFYIKVNSDVIVQQMIYEKLGQEYELILDIHKEIGVLMKFDKPENTSIETIIIILEKLSGFMYNILNTMPVYESLLRLKDVHKKHSSIFMTTYESSIRDDYDNNVFKLTDEEIVAKNTEILENSKRLEVGKLDIKYNDLKLNDVKCSNE